MTRSYRLKSPLEQMRWRKVNPFAISTSAFSFTSTLHLDRSLTRSSMDGYKMMTLTLIRGASSVATNFLGLTERLTSMNAAVYELAAHGEKVFCETERRTRYIVIRGEGGLKSSYATLKRTRWTRYRERKETSVSAYRRCCTSLHTFYMHSQLLFVPVSCLIKVSSTAPR